MTDRGEDDPHTMAPDHADSTQFGVGVRESDDRTLLARVRAGEDDAFAKLFARHAGAVRAFAVRCTADRAEAEDMAAEAFFRVLQAVRRGAGPDDNVRGYLLTVVRRLAAEWNTRRRDFPVTDEELRRLPEPENDHTASRVDQHLIARAFASLPTRWRSVLWRVEVEGERPAVAAEHFGLSANATAALARRAREGLCAAYLQAHVAPSVGPASCRTVIDKLGAYTAGGLRGTEPRRIRAHLAACASCESLHAELADVCAGLRRYAGPLAPPVSGATLAAHHPVAKVASFISKMTAYGTRLKVGVAAASMAVAGGLGVLGAPLFGHFAPDNQADRDVLEIAMPSGTSSASTPLGTSTGPVSVAATSPADDRPRNHPSARRGPIGTDAGAAATGTRQNLVPFATPLQVAPPVPTTGDYQVFAGSAEPTSDKDKTDNGRAGKHRKDHPPAPRPTPASWTTVWSTVWTTGYPQSWHDR